MRLWLTLFLIFALGGSAVMAAPQPIDTGLDIQKPAMTKAVVTLSQAKGDMQAVLFGNVNSLQSCLGLAVAATRKGWKESSATCLDPKGRAIATYFCDRKKDSTHCRSTLPDL